MITAAPVRAGALTRSILAGAKGPSVFADANCASKCNANGYVYSNTYDHATAPPQQRQIRQQLRLHLPLHPQRLLRLRSPSQHLLRGLT